MPLAIYNSHCSYCGQPFAADQPWPRRCAACHNITYRNPLPVAVTLLPVEGGLLAVRRAHDPGRGKVALPGGYIDVTETWQEAAARELNEETGIEIDPQIVLPFRVYSAPDGALLVFGLAPRFQDPLPAFTPNSEASERLIVRRPEPMAFSLHTRVVEEYFGEFPVHGNNEPGSDSERRTS